MSNNTKKQTPKEQLNIIIEKIKTIPRKYFYITGAVLLVIIASLSIWTAIDKSALNKMADEVLPQSLITFANNNNPVYVTKDLQLLQEFSYNDKTYTIEWKSNDKKVIDNTGVVIRPTSANENVVLTATIKKGITNIQMPYELTVICNKIIDATEMTSLTGNPIKDNDILTGIYFDENKLLLNTDIDAALFAEHYIQELSGKKIKVSFVKVEPSLTGNVFIFKQANQGVKLQDTFINVFVNKKGNPIEISLYLEPKEVVNDTQLISEKDVITAAVNLRGIDAKNIYEIVEQYVDGEKVYKVSHMTDNEMYAFYITNKEIAENKDTKAENTPKITDINKLYQTIIKDYTKVNPNVYRGINIYHQNNENADIYTEISKNIHKTSNWFTQHMGMWSFDNRGVDVSLLIENDTSVNLTRYNTPLQLFYFNHAEGYNNHMGTSLDVVAHEYSHAVFTNIVGNIDKPTIEVKAIEEAYADVFACLIDGDWIIGEDLDDGTKVLRAIDSNDSVSTTLNKTSTQYKDENWSDTNAYINSVLLTKVACLMEQEGISDEDIAKIWYHSMFYGYHNESTFKDVQNNLIRAAMALNYSEKTIEIINESFQEIGL